MDNRLEARAIECVRGLRSLFRDVSLTMQSGIGLHAKGINGSGKTSLLRILCGLSVAESGAVFWNGADIRRIRTEYHSQICYLGHKPGLKGELTPMENLIALMALQGRSLDRRIIAKSLETLGILPCHEHPCRKLSAGQQQRTALARVRLSDAPLWILDEPATALDESGIHYLNGILQEHLNRGGLLVFTSHQPLLPSLALQTIEMSGCDD